jgi:hypothetical protein
VTDESKNEAKVDENLRAVELATDKYYTAHQLSVESEDYAFNLQLLRDSFAEGDPTREYLNAAIGSLNRVTNLARENIETAMGEIHAAQTKYESSVEQG